MTCCTLCTRSSYSWLAYFSSGSLKEHEMFMQQLKTLRGFLYPCYCMMAVSPVPFSQFGPSILAAHLIVVQRCCFWNDNDIRLLLNQERQNDIILHSTPTHVVGKTAFKEQKKVNYILSSSFHLEQARWCLAQIWFEQVLNYANDFFHLGVEEEGGGVVTVVMEIGCHSRV